MATANPYVLTGPTGTRLYGGRFPVGNGTLSGGAVLGDVAAGGGIGVATPVGAQVATLAAYNVGGLATLPYSATVLPLRGQVPTGQTLRSTDDATLRAAVVSRWDDGSAAVVVVSGSKAFAAGASAITLQSSSAADAAVGVSAITALVSSLAVEFGGGFGTAAATVASPERTWWDTGGVICARYRLAAPTPGATALEAVIDVHAYAGSLFAEMVVENCKVDASGTPVTPADANYGTAVLKINGSTVATVATPTRGTRLAGSPITLTGVDVSVLSFAFGAPPGSPTTGAAYALWSSGTTGDWAGRGGQIATWNGSAWDYTAAVAGNMVRQTASYDWPRIWTGSAWEAAHLGTHEGHRAAYASGWVGTSGAGLRMTQLHTELQANPMFWEAAAANSADMSTYASDAYVQFGPGRHPSAQMGNVGDHPSIGPLPTAAAFALVTGDYRAWKATEAEDLAVLGYNVNYRHSTGASAGLVPCVNETGNRSQQTGWPGNGNNAEAMQWKDSHHPAAGLAGFVSRPSPVFIEIAQKVALKVGTTYSNNDGGPTRAIGVFVASFQTRAQAWGMRSLGHATFLSPDGSTWKAGGQGSIAANVAHFDEWRTSPLQTALAIMWENRVDRPIARNGNTTRVNYKLWQYHYFLSEMAKIAGARLVTAGANQTALDTFVDWGLLHPVRWINDQATTGAWRHMPEALVLGTAVQTAPAMTNATDYATQRATWTTEAPSVAAVAGTWMAASLDSPTDYSSQWGADTTAGLSRATYFWTALVAAVNRNVPGAAEAYWHVRNNITNFDTWLSGFGSAPRWGANPRTIPPPAGFAVGGGTGSLVGDLWTPAKAPDGRVYAESWATVPTGRFIEVAGTLMSTMDAEILAALPSWASKLTWDSGVAGNYSGLVVDPPRARAWYAGAGGHSDGFGNNGIYRFDGYRMAWAVERLPSNRALWSTGYATLGTTITYTGCPESLAQENAQRTAGTWAAADAAGNAWGHDEVYWANPAISGASGVGDPTSRHTYYASSYNPLTDELYIGSGTPTAGGTGRRIWAYSRTLGRWIWKRSVAISADGAVNGHILDAAGGKLRVWGAGDGVNASYTLNLNTGVFDYTSWFPLGGRDAATVVVGGTVVGAERMLSDYPDRNHYFVYTPASNTAVSATWQYGGGLSAASFASSAAPEGQSIAYIPSLNRYWLYTSGLWWQLDPTTAPWTALPLTLTGAVPSSFGGHVYSKFMYVPDLNALLVFLSGSANARVYKF